MRNRHKPNGALDYHLAWPHLQGGRNEHVLPRGRSREKGLSFNFATHLASQDRRWFEVAANRNIGSNYGTQYSTIAAPGRMIYSTVPALAANSKCRYRTIPA